MEIFIIFFILFSFYMFFSRSIIFTWLCSQKIEILLWTLILWIIRQIRFLLRTIQLIITLIVKNIRIINQIDSFGENAAGTLLSFGSRLGLLVGLLATCIVSNHILEWIHHFELITIVTIINILFFITFLVEIEIHFGIVYFWRCLRSTFILHFGYRLWIYITLETYFGVQDVIVAILYIYHHVIRIVPFQYLFRCLLLLKLLFLLLNLFLLV